MFRREVSISYRRRPLYSCLGRGCICGGWNSRWSKGCGTRSLCGRLCVRNRRSAGTIRAIRCHAGGILLLVDHLLLLLCHLSPLLLKHPLLLHVREQLVNPLEFWILFRYARVLHLLVFLRGVSIHIMERKYVRRRWIVTWRVSLRLWPWPGIEVPGCWTAGAV